MISDDATQWLAVCYGCGVSLALSWAGYALLMRVPGSNPGMFMKLVLGGMAARILAALGMIVLGIGVFRLPAGMLVGSCMLSYVMFMTLEHIFALPALKRKKTHTS